MKSAADVIYAHSEENCVQNAAAVRDKRKEELSIQWKSASECFYNCIVPGTGMRLVERRPCPLCNTTLNIQTCQHSQVSTLQKTIEQN